MPADITSSNFPPTAKEESVLRALLKQKEDELKAFTEHIIKARTSVTSSTDAIGKLMKSRGLACTTVTAYNAHIKNLSASLELFETRFALYPRDTASPDPTPCVALSDLLTPDIHKRKANIKLEIKELEEMHAKVKATILDIDEELRCQRYINKINSKSLESYLAIHEMTQSAVDEISGAFRAIKRVPNEIWSDILGIRISKDSNTLNPPGLPLFLPALPITQVCRTWRSVVRSSRSMWRAIGWRMSPDDKPNYNYLNMWGDLSGQKRLTVYELQPSARPSAVQILRSNVLDHSQDLCYHVFQSMDVPNEFNADEDPKYPIHTLFLYAPPLSRNTKVQPRIYSQFSSVRQLLLLNLLPHRGLALQDSLTHLTICFSQPHKSYTLSRLLIPSLIYLCLEHFEANGTPDLTETIQLPNLRSLDITPIEYKLVEKLAVPKLSRLILSSPVKVSASPEGWLDSIVTLCATLVDLEINCSSTEKNTGIGDTMKFDVLQILAKLCPQKPKLHQVKLVGGAFEGRGLADIFDNKEDGEAHIHKLKELTIDNCVGVSQMDCERLVQLVGKLNVYRTFHKDGKLSRELSQDS